MFRLSWEFRRLAGGTSSLDPMNWTLAAHRARGVNPWGGRP